VSASSSAVKAPRIVVVFRNDDPSAVSDVAHERRLFEIFEHWGVPQTIGVVPNMTRGDRHARDNGGFAPLASNPALVELLAQHCAKTGSELALHGFTHQTNRFSIPARRFYFEFARLPLAEQEELLREGANMLEQATGVRPRTFIPPWNRFDRNTVTACENTGFKVLSTHVFVPSPQTIVPFGSNSSLPAFAQHLEAARRSERRVFIHLLLHTPLMRSEGERQLLDDALRAVRREPDCEAMTVIAAAERFSDELREFNRAGHSIIKLYEEMDSPRARAHVYARVGLENRVAALRRSATEHYRAGNYAACLPLDARIDQWSQRFLWGCRLAALLAGVAFSKLIVASLPGLATAILATSFVALWLAVMAVMAKATSPDSRREVAMLAGFANSGLLIGRFV
jgi:predicted deacetylase